MGNRLIVGLIAALGCAACGAGASAGAPSASARSDRSPPPQQAAAPPSRQGQIDRAELDAVLAGGLGRFLQRVETQPHLDDGRFVGFRLTDLRSELFEGVDLQPGDTVLTVNGMAIERPEQALRAWEGLRVASELTVELLREGRRRQLRFAIVD